jgi:LuxR family quorum sensing-dependent transcriptional regulator
MTSPEEIKVFEKSMRDAGSPNGVFDALRRFLSSHGATHLLVTGLPMPGRAVGPLVHFIQWPARSGGDVDPADIPPDDPLLERCRISHRPFRLEARELQRPSSLAAAVPAGPFEFLAVPIAAIPAYQACVVAGGPALALAEFDLHALDFLCDQAFRRLSVLRDFTSQRPGDLSARERRVLELSALGMTAQDIADTLNISQRTVHAHLQNAGDKLHASNKTQTVVEALRYRQIELAESDTVAERRA